jgi:hypothetical protein
MLILERRKITCGAQNQKVLGLSSERLLRSFLSLSIPIWKLVEQSPCQGVWPSSKMSHVQVWLRART